MSRRAFFRGPLVEPVFGPGGAQTLDDSTVYYRYGNVMWSASDPNASHSYATTVPQSASDLNNLNRRRYGLPEQRPAAPAPRTLAELAARLRAHYADCGR